MKTFLRTFHWLALFAARVAFSQVNVPINNDSQLVTPTRPATVYQGIFLDPSGVPVTSLAVDLLHDTGLIGDTNALFYLTSVNVQNEADRNRIALFFARMKRTLLLPLLADGGLLRTNYGASSNLTLFGRSCVSSNLTFTKFGALFNSNSVGPGCVMVSGIPDLRTNTLVAVVRSPGGPDLVTWPQNLIGAYDANGARGVRISYDAYGAALFREAGSESSPGTTYFGYFSSSNYEVRDYRRRVVACTFSGTNCQAFYDGQACVMNGTSVSPTFKPLGPLTVVRLGSDPGATNALIAEVSAWLVFNSVLTASQIAKLDWCLLALEPGKRRVFIGDSLTQLSTSELQSGQGALTGSSWWTNSWPAWYMAAGSFSDDFVWYDEAQSGLTTTSWSAGAGYSFLTNRIAMLSGEPVEWWVGPLGANDGLQGFTADTSVASESNILATLVGKGEIIVTTMNGVGTNIATSVAGGTSWTDVPRLAINAWLRANPKNFNRIVERDLLFNSTLMNNTNLGGVTRDGLHMRSAGNQLAANLAHQASSVSYDASGNILSALAGGSAYTTVKVIWPYQMNSTGTRDFTTFGPVKDCWDAAGAIFSTSFAVDTWVTRQVVTVTIIGAGTSTNDWVGGGYYANRASVYNTAPSTLGTVTRSGLATFNGFTSIAFTNTWPQTNADKWFSIVKSTANGTHGIVKAQVQWFGNPNPDDASNVPIQY